MKKNIKLFTLFVFATFSHAVFAENPKALIQTSEGTIEVELFADKSPVSVKNFIEYAQSGFYENTIFHRVIPGFMVQGGGLTTTMEKKTTKDPIINEADNGLSNKRGTLAMARTGEPNSATSQFFINTVDNGFLNHKSKDNGQTWGYTVFAQVTKGMDVVDSISAMQTTTKAGRRDVPVKEISITSVRLLEADKDKKETSVDKKSN